MKPIIQGLNAKLAPSLHLPTCSRAAPWADFSEASNDNNFLQVDEALQMGEIGERPRQLGLGEFEFEVGARRYRDISKDSLCVWTVCDLVIQSVVARDGFAKVA